MTQFWGNAYWSLIHNYSLNFDISSNDRCIIFLEFLYNIDYAIPCDKCKTVIITYCEYQENYIELQKCKSRLDFFKWSVNLHNHVNKKLDKQIYDYQDVINYYTKNYNSETNEYTISVPFYHIFWNFLLISSTFTTFQTNFAIILYNLYTYIIKTTFDTVSANKYINKLTEMFDTTNNFYISNTILREGIDSIEKEYVSDFFVDYILGNQITLYDYSDISSNIITIGYSNIENSSNHLITSYERDNTIYSDYIDTANSNISNVQINITYSSSNYTKTITHSIDNENPDNFINTISFIDSIDIDIWKTIYLDTSLGYSMHMQNFNQNESLLALSLNHINSIDDNIIVNISQWWCGFMYIYSIINNRYKNTEYVTISKNYENLYKSNNIPITYIEKYELYNYKNSMCNYILYIHSLEFVFNKQKLLQECFNTASNLQKIFIIEFYRKNNFDILPCKINAEGYYSDGILYEYQWENILHTLSTTNNISVIYKNYEFLSYYDVLRIYDSLELCSSCYDYNYLVNLKNTLAVIMQDWNNSPLNILCIILQKTTV